MIVRRASSSDLPAIVAIYNHAVEHTTATFDLEPATLDERRVWAEQFSDDNPLFVAADSTEVLGFAYYLPYRSKPAYAPTKETTIYVHPDAHGRGVGSALYEVLLPHAAAHGVHALIAVLGGANPASTALHEKFSFRRIGRLPEVGFKHGGWVDTEIWHRLVSPVAHGGDSTSGT